MRIAKIVFVKLVSIKLLVVRFPSQLCREVLLFIGCTQPASKCLCVSCSVVILAFVKSEGKTVKKRSHPNGGLPKDETTALLSDNTNSLEGSLRERVVSSATAIFVECPPRGNVFVASFPHFTP